MAYFPDIECWSNAHIVHGIMAILGIVLYYSLCIVMTLTYFECRYVINDATARITGRSIGLFFSYELLMIICYTFMQESVYDYL